MSWRERRKEIGQLQRARKFKQAQDVRRSFKVEIEELKRRTRCNKCGAVGHWARECKAHGKGTSSSKGASFKGASKGKENAAALVVEEGFIATVSSQHAPWLSLQLLRDKLTPSPDIGVEQLLVSSPGYGVLDSGCGRSIIGADTLAEFMELWKARDMTIPTPFDEVNHFKYGNGHGETTQRSIRVPVVLGGRSGTIKAAIVQGQAPLLVSRSALKALKAAINFDTDELTVFDSRTVVPLSTNQAGEFTVDLLGSHPWTESFAEVMLLGDGSKPQPSCEHSHSTEPSVTPESTPCADTPSSSSQDMPVLVVWSRVDEWCSQVPSIGKQGPRWTSVRRRIVTDELPKKYCMMNSVSHN